MLMMGVGEGGVGEGLRLVSRFGSNFEVKLDALLGRDFLLSWSGMEPSDHRDLKIFSPIKGVGVAATAVGGTEGRRPLDNMMKTRRGKAGRLEQGEWAAERSEEKAKRGLLWREMREEGGEG
jgi:hypothetical protein